MQDEWKKWREMPLPFEGGPRATQDSLMDIEEVEQAVVPQAEVCGASSEAPSVVSSVRKVSVMILRLTGLTAGQRGRAPGDEGAGGASGKNRCKVAVPLVYMGRENACDACKTQGRHLRGRDRCGMRQVPTPERALQLCAGKAGSG